MLPTSLCIPPIVIALAFGVAPPSLSSSPATAPGPVDSTGEERKSKGDSVDAVWERVLRGVACDPYCKTCEACEASACSCSSGPTGGGLDVTGARALRRGVTDADER